MQTTDPGLLFQTSAQLAEASDRERKIEAAAKIGDPIKLSGKILDLKVIGDDAWTAESGWQARCVDLSVSGSSRLSESLLTDRRARSRSSTKGTKVP